jgi:hypothetical protein
VLYVVVVLLAANFLARRGVLMVSAACMVLTTVSYVATHHVAADAALAGRS